MLSITDLKKGALITLDGQPYRVVEYNQKQMGRGGSIVNTKVRNLITGNVRNETFQGSDRIEEAEVTNRKAQFLYADNELHFMDNESYEQYDINSDILSFNQNLLKEGQNCTVQLFNGNPINVDMPVKIELKVISAPDVVKGDTQSTVLKEVETETGANIQTPIFIKTGDSIVVDTRDSSYVERVK